MLDPRRSDVSPANAFWISGENDAGEIVSTNAARIYYWPDTNFGEQAVAMWYGRDEGQPVIVSTDVAKSISGVVQNMGSAWVRPDYRSRGLSHLLPRISRAYGLSRWPVDWIIAFVTMAHRPERLRLRLRRSAFQRQRHLSGTPSARAGVIVAYTTRDEAYDDLDSYLAELSEASGTRYAAALGRNLGGARGDQHLAGRRPPRQQEPLVAHDVPGDRFGPGSSIIRMSAVTRS